MSASEHSPVAPAASAERRRAGGRVPDFFIAGQPKSGTTALYEMLRRHPQIYMPELKEPLFFASDLRPAIARRPREAGTRPPFPVTYEEYLELFAAAAPEQRAGEATPTYLRSHVAAGAIARVQPGARIVAIFREPASFLRSLHLQWLQEHLENEPDLERAMAREQDRRAGRLGAGERPQARTLLYSEFVRYAEQLERFAAVFPREQLLVLIYDDFRADNQAVVRQVLRFLEVDDSHPLEELEANPTIAARSVRLERMVLRAQSGRGAIAGPARAAVKALTPRGMRRRVFYPLRRRLLYRDPEPADEALTARLRRRFEPEVQALGEYIGRDLLALWGYRSPG
ncbi:MAG TPA: sulfotransferase [Solirubrobacteraceae bacterium]|jgi:hypothetical protein|nr:sulfotransferase [Solirubrobacteraceae bacterium]